MVMNPLGIVTATELTFSVLFVALLIWALSNYIYRSYSAPPYDQHDNAKL